MFDSMAPPNLATVARHHPPTTSTTTSTTVPPQSPSTPDSGSGSRTPPTDVMTSTYTFPHNKLKRRLSRANKTPLVLVACGSFSPITVLHLQMFHMTERYVEGTDFEVVGSYLSPVSDAYRKPSLAPADHRMAMCSLATENTNVMVDPWEPLRCDRATREPVYTRTVDALRHFDYEINDVLGGIQTPDGGTSHSSNKRARVVLLIGADVAMTMSDPKNWAPADLDDIFGRYGAFVVERPNQTDIHKALEPLKKYGDNLWVVGSFYNDVSSTKIRAQLRNGEIVLDLPKSVIEYIRMHELYQGGGGGGAQPTTPATAKEAKGRTQSNNSVPAPLRG